MEKSRAHCSRLRPLRSERSSLSWSWEFFHTARQNGEAGGRAPSSRTSIVRRSLEPIPFKRDLYSKEGCRASQRWVHAEALHQQAHQRSRSPKLIGPSIASHTPLQEPVFGYVKKHIGGLLVVDTVEKPIPPTGTVSPLFLYLELVNAAIRRRAGRLIPAESSGWLPKPKCLVAGRIEDFFHVFVGGGCSRGTAGSGGHYAEKFAGQCQRSDFDQLHGTKYGSGDCLREISSC